MLKPKRRPWPSESSDCILSRLCAPVPYIPLSAQPYDSCLHLPSAGIKGIGSSLCADTIFFELCLSFRQIRSCVAQGGLELTEIRLLLVS